MPVEFRRYREADIEDLLNKLHDNHLSKPHLARHGFSREKTGDLLRGNLNSSMFFLTVAVEDNQVIGALCASVYTYVFSYEAEAVDHLFLVLEGHRSMEVVNGLATAYVEWAKARKVKRAQLRNVTGDRVELFSRLATKLGFKLIGTNHAMEF